MYRTFMFKRKYGEIVWSRPKTCNPVWIMSNGSRRGGETEEHVRLETVQTPLDKDCEITNAACGAACTQEGRVRNEHAQATPDRQHKMHIADDPMEEDIQRVV